MMSKQWYVIHTYSGYEHKAKAALEERIKTLGKQDHFAEADTLDGGTVLPGLALPVQVIFENIEPEPEPKARRKQNRGKKRT